MPTLYKIAGWQKHFETHESRKLQRLPWVAIPTKHDGLGFRTLAAQKNAGDLYAAWILLVQIASKGRKDERGILARDGRPLTPQDLHLMTGFPARIFEGALAFFSQPLVGWLVAEPPPGHLPASAGTPADGPENLPAHNITGQDITVSSRPAKPGRQRNELFDALAKAEGSDPNQLTTRAASTIGVALAEIRKASPDVTPDEIARRAARYPRVMPQGSTLTASALAKQWARCTPVTGPTAPILPAPPKDWRARLHRLYPEARADLTWATLTPEVRAQILNQ